MTRCDTRSRACLSTSERAFICSFRRSMDTVFAKGSVFSSPLSTLPSSGLLGVNESIKLATHGVSCCCPALDRRDRLKRHSSDTVGATAAPVDLKAVFLKGLSTTTVPAPTPTTDEVDALGERGDTSSFDTSDDDVSAF